MNPNYFAPFLNPPVDLRHNFQHFQQLNIQDNLCREQFPRPKTPPPPDLPALDHLESIKDSPAYFLEFFLGGEVMDWLTTEANTKNKTFTQDELRCFLAVLFLSGYCELPRRRMLWERSPDTHNTFVAGAVQRDRFEAIFAVLLGEGKSYEGFLEKLTKKFLLYTPDDVQYSVGQIAKKKMWCGCGKSGYCNFFWNGIGSKATILDFVKKVRQVRVVGEVVFERRYAEAELLYELNNLGVKPFFSNRDGASFANPLNGIDKLEKNLNLYPISMKGKKSAEVFGLALDLAVSNAYTLYKISKSDGKSLDLLNFRRSIVVYYLQRYGKPQGAKSVKFGGKKKVGSDARYDGIKHYVVPQAKQTRCTHCSAKTTTRCVKCDTGVHVKCFFDFHTRPK